MMTTRSEQPAASVRPATDFLSGLDTALLKQRFEADDEFLFVDNFLPAVISADLQARVPKLMDAVHRNYIPKHNKGGSLSRYTLLLGVVDDSTSQHGFELFKKDAGRESVRDARNQRPGAPCFFHGDKLWHRITPLGAGERRISLTFEYVSDP